MLTTQRYIDGCRLTRQNSKSIVVHISILAIIQARVDKTYIRVKGKWKYLYRSVDSSGNTIDFMLSAKRDKRAAKRFFGKALKATHSQLPRVINVDKNAAYPIAFEALKTEETLAGGCELRQNK